MSQPIGGTFMLHNGGMSSQPLPYDADDATIQATLDTLPRATTLPEIDRMLQDADALLWRMRIAYAQKHDIAVQDTDLLFVHEADDRAVIHIVHRFKGPDQQV